MERKEGVSFHTWSRYWNPNSDRQTQDLVDQKAVLARAMSLQQHVVAERTEGGNQVISQRL